MKRIDKTELFAQSENVLLGMIDAIGDCGAIRFGELTPSRTLMIIVDMVNGFAKEGVLSSPRINELILPISDLQKICYESGARVIAFEDGHTKCSVEFKGRPEHCLLGTPETETVDELVINGIHSFHKKNSTNGLMQEAFFSWLKQNALHGYDNFIVTGCCTDICVHQLALTLKAFFNECNYDKRVIVPANAVDTYDAPGHNADLMNIFSLYQMIDNGIEVVSEIE